MYNIKETIDLYNEGMLECTFFYGHTRGISQEIGKECLSQWYVCGFKDENGIDFISAEQYMMYNKAILFGDLVTAHKILESTTQFDIKRLGREVKDFNEKKWIENREKIVMKGNIFKFTQNKKLKDFIMTTENTILVEASPTDDIWGIKMGMCEPGVNNPNNWRGYNLLGFILTDVRELIYYKEATGKIPDAKKINGIIL